MLPGVKGSFENLRSMPTQLSDNPCQSECMSVLLSWAPHQQFFKFTKISIIKTHSFELLTQKAVLKFQTQIKESACNLRSNVPSYKGKLT